MEYHSAVKTNKIIPFAAKRIDLETVLLNEANQTENSRCHISLIC